MKYVIGYWRYVSSWYKNYGFVRQVQLGVPVFEFMGVKETSPVIKFETPHRWYKNEKEKEKWIAAAKEIKEIRTFDPRVGVFADQSLELNRFFRKYINSNGNRNC